MKNIYEILSAFGIAVPDDKKAELDKEILQNYKTIADYNKQGDKLKLAEDKVQTAEAALKKFDGVDVATLQTEISNLKTDLGKKDTEYQQKIAEMEFDGLLSGVVSSAKGRNVKAIKAMLDMDTLKASKNQEADIKAALDSLQKEHGYLFEAVQPPPPFAAGTGTAPASNKYSPELAAIRSAAGLKNE